MAVHPDLIARGLGALPSQLGLGSATPRFHVYIRDAAYRRVAELSEWISFKCIPWFNDVGTWALECSSDTLEIDLLTKSGGVVVTREIEGVETTVFSGFVWTEWGYTETTFRASGYSDEALLWTPARPTPSLASPPFPDAYEVTTGQASGIMIGLVFHNLGVGSAPDEWAVPALRFADDPLLGSTVTARANLQPLITLLAEMAITPYAGGLGFSLRQSDLITNKIEFVVYAPPDRSGTAKFSVDLGTAASYEDIASAPEANHVYVMGGDGFGRNRTIIEESDADSIAEWGRRISTVVDMRGVTDTGELNQRAAEEIAKVSTLRRTAITPFDVPSLQYGRDYDLGTLVTVVTKSGEQVALIRQVEINLDPERGATVTPIVGQGDGSDDERTATMIRTIQGRLGNVERNWGVPDDSITPSMIAAIDAPADDGLVPVYDAATGRFEWADALALSSLSVSGISALGVVTASGIITGASTVQGTRLISTVATGTAPLVVASTTRVENLNADLLDGMEASAFATDAELADYALLTDLAGYAPLGGASFTGNISTTGDLTVNGSTTLGNAGTDTVTVSGDLTVGDDLTVTGQSTFTSAATFNADVSVPSGTFTHSNSGNKRLEMGSTGIGFFGSAQQAKQTVVGSRGGNVALKNTLDALANYGLVIDLTTV